MKIQSGDIFISKEDGNGIVVEREGELMVIFPDMWYPVNSFLKEPEVYKVIKVVRPESNSDCCRAIFKNEYSGLEVFLADFPEWMEDPEEKIAEGMVFHLSNHKYHEFVTLIQVAYGEYKIFAEGDCNRVNDIVYESGTKLIDFYESMKKNGYEICDMNYRAKMKFEF